MSKINHSAKHVTDAFGVDKEALTLRMTHAAKMLIDGRGEMPKSVIIEWMIDNMKPEELAILAFEEVERGVVRSMTKMMIDIVTDED